MLIRRCLGCVCRTPFALPYYYLLLNNPAYSIHYVLSFLIVIYNL